MAERIRRYELRERIGVGGMAEAWLADAIYGESLKRPVVVKKMLPHLSIESEYQAMFMDEARIAASLDHPNIVQLVDLGRMDDTLFLALEYIDGADLAALLRAEEAAWRRIPLSVALWITGEVLLGLHYVHTRRAPDGSAMELVHRDVGLGNVLVSKRGEVKLSDFGIAKAAARLSQTAVGMIKGNLLSMAPEQINRQAITSRTDIYAAGLMLHALLIGRHPLEDVPTPQLFDVHAAGNLPLPSASNPAIDPQLDAIVRRATALDPIDRFDSAAHFAEVLREFALREGVESGPGVLARELDALDEAATLEANEPTITSNGTITRPVSKLAYHSMIAEVVVEEGETVFRTRVDVPTLPPENTFRKRVTGLAQRVAPPSEVEVTRLSEMEMEKTLPSKIPLWEEEKSSTAENLLVLEDSQTVSVEALLEPTVTAESPSYRPKPGPLPPPSPPSGGPPPPPDWQPLVPVARRPTPAPALPQATRVSEPLPVERPVEAPASPHPTRVSVPTPPPEIEPLHIGCTFVGVLAGHRQAVNALAVGPGVVASASSDGTIILWDVDGKKAAQILRGHKGPATSLSASSDGSVLLSGSRDGTVRLWHRDTAAAMLTMKGHQRWVSSVALLGEGLRGVSGGDDRTVRVWDLLSENPERTIEAAHDDYVSVVTFVPGTSFALSASYDRTLRLWDATTGAPLKTLAGREPIRALDVDPTGKMALAGTADGRLWLWDLATGDNVATFTAHKDAVGAVRFVGDRLAFSAGFDGVIGIWDIAARRQIAMIDRKDYEPIMALAVSGGRLFASSGSTVLVWQLEGLPG